MKLRKNDRVQIVILTVLALAVILSLVIPQLIRTREPRRLSLSVLLRESESAGFSTTRQGMEQAADELGAELRFLTLSSPNDSAEQAESLLREVSEGADALILVPTDPDALTLALSQISGRCPAVSLEAAVDGFAGAAAPDNALLGAQLAQALLADWDQGAVFLLDTGWNAPGVLSRLRAAREALEDAGVPTRTVSALPEEEPVRWAMAFEPSATRQAADRNSRLELPFALYGVGSTTAIINHLEKGAITSLAVWNDYAAGYLAVRQAVEAIGGTPDPLEPLPFSILRGEDIYEPENQKLLFPVTS